MKDARLEMRIDPALKARVVAEAGRKGQKVTTFVERALESALGDAGPPPQVSPVSSRAPVFRQAHREVPKVPGVTTAREVALERQRRLNEGKG